MDKVGATLLTHIYELITTSTFHAASKHKKSRDARFTPGTTRIDHQLLQGGNGIKPSTQHFTNLSGATPLRQ